MGENPCDLGLGEDLLDATLKPQYINEQIDKLDCLKMEKNPTKHNNNKRLFFQRHCWENEETSHWLGGEYL